MEQPPIEIFGIKILEPVTTGTDLIVSAICFFAFIKLVTKEKNSRVVLFLKLYFILMGISTALGGLIGHAFLYKFSTTWEPTGWIKHIIANIDFLIAGEGAYAWKLPGWIVSMLSIMFIERASIEHVRPIVHRSVGNSFKVINIIELIIFMAITIITLNFKYVEIHSGYGLMFVVLSLQLYAYLTTRNKGSKYFLFGVGWALIAALFYMNEVSFHAYFNYNDISHVFMAVAAAFFYIGARNLTSLRDAEKIKITSYPGRLKWIINRNTVYKNAEKTDMKVDENLPEER